MDQSHAVKLINSFVEAFIRADEFAAVFGPHPPRDFVFVAHEETDSGSMCGLKGISIGMFRAFMLDNRDKLTKESLRLCELYLAVNALENMG